MTALVTKHIELLSGAPGGVDKLRMLFRQLAVTGQISNDGDSSAKSDWRRTTFGQVFSLEYGDNLPAPKRSGTGEFPVYGSNGVVGSHNECCVSAPCIVVGRKGSAGAVNICEHEGCWVTDVAYSCVPPDDVALRFAFVLFQTLGLDELGKGIKPGLSRSEAYALPVSIPPLAEQHRIVAKVDELMALCDRLEAEQADAEAAHAKLVEALLASLTQARDAADFRASWQQLAEHFHTLFTTEASVEALKACIRELGVKGRLVEQLPDEASQVVLELVAAERVAALSQTKLTKHNEQANTVHWACPFSLPRTWCWVSLSALTLQITDGTHHTPTYVEQGVPFISVKDLDGRTVSFADCRLIPEAEHREINTRCNPERGDILLCRIGTLGRPTVVDTDQRFSLFVSVGLLKLPKRVDLSAYLHLVLSSPLGYQQYQRIKAGGSHTNKLNLGDLPKIMIPVPPLEEQRRIVAKVDELLTLCDQLSLGLNRVGQHHERLASLLVDQAVA